jgi:hypothetical protein
MADCPDELVSIYFGTVGSETFLLISVLVTRSY